MTEDTPRYTHDCTCCVYLGNFLTAHGGPYPRIFDLYYHGGELPTVIARFGDEGPDYASGLSFARSARRTGRYDNPLYHAMRRATERGLLIERDYFIGESQAYTDQLWQDYRASDYYKGLPRLEDYCDPLDEDASDAHVELGEDEYDKACRAYDNAWRAQHGSVPATPTLMTCHLFEDRDAAVRCCGEENVTRIRAHSDADAREQLQDTETARVERRRREQLKRRNET